MFQRVPGSKPNRNKSRRSSPMGYWPKRNTWRRCTTPSSFGLNPLTRALMCSSRLSTQRHPRRSSSRLCTHSGRPVCDSIRASGNCLPNHKSTVTGWWQDTSSWKIPSSRTTITIGNSDAPANQSCLWCNCPIWKRIWARWPMQRVTSSWRHMYRLCFMNIDQVRHAWSDTNLLLATLRQHEPTTHQTPNHLPPHRVWFHSIRLGGYQSQPK
jgi:hypothetical protein